ncbi:hypothetical protein ACYSNR_12080 [Enterococcus sp. LJL128]|uniref:hypothetical protein n=1 Tax=Enterococcus sp. LJL51 TaxID=3416656 RepID=UPI003CF59ED2
MKKIVWIFSLVIFSLFTWGSEASAETADSIAKEDNIEAIARLKELDGLESCPIPLENLTTRQPADLSSQTLSPLLRNPSNRKIFRYDAYSYVYNIWQFYSPELAPVGFNWFDNGIPYTAVSTDYIKNGFRFTNNVWDSGVGGWDLGRYWRNFSTRYHDGQILTFWARVDNLYQLLYY